MSISRGSKCIITIQTLKIYYPTQLSDEDYDNLTNYHFIVVRKSYSRAIIKSIINDKISIRVPYQNIYSINNNVYKLFKKTIKG